MPLTAETAADAARALGWQAGDTIQDHKPGWLLRVRLTEFGGEYVFGRVVMARPASDPDAPWEDRGHPEPWIWINSGDVRRCRKAGA